MSTPKKTAKKSRLTLESNMNAGLGIIQPPHAIYGGSLPPGILPGAPTPIPGPVHVLPA